MSHRICYHHLAISFPSKELEKSYPAGRLAWERSYYRTWSVIEYGNDTRIMESAVRSAAFCEGGHMRLYGERYTYPESYIRRIRNVLANAVHFKEARGYGFSLAAELELNLSHPCEDALTSINLHVNPKEQNGKQYWPLSPLDNPLHAALLMLYGRSIDTRPTFMVMAADGPRFKNAARNFFHRPLKHGRLKPGHDQSDDVAA